MIYNILLSVDLLGISFFFIILWLPWLLVFILNELILDPQDFFY